MRILEGHEGVIPAIQFSPDGETLVSAGKDGSLRLWDTWGGCTILSMSEMPLPAQAFNSDGQFLATAFGGSLRVWDVRKRSLKATRSLSGSVVTGLAFLPGDETIAFSLGSNTVKHGNSSAGIRLWDWSKDALRTLPVDVAPTVAVRALSLHRERRLLAWVTETSSLTIWNLLKPDSLRIPLKSPSRAIAFSADGNALAATIDWKIILFDIERKQERLTIAGHKGIVSTLAYSPDGRYLMSGSWDKTVKFWDCESGREIASFEWPVGRIGAVAFAADGLRAAAAGDNGTIVIWDVDF